MLLLWPSRPKTLQIFVSSRPAGDTALWSSEIFVRSTMASGAQCLSIGSRTNHPPTPPPVQAGGSQNFDCRPLGSIINSAGQLSRKHFRLFNKMSSVLALGAGAAVAAFLVRAHRFSQFVRFVCLTLLSRAGLVLSHGDVREVVLERWARPSTREVLRPR